MPVKAPADKRFKRARVQAPRRRRSWKAWVVSSTKAVLGLAALIYGTHYVLTTLTSTPSLTIRRVQIQGNRQLSSAQVMKLLTGLPGTNILRADLDGWRERLLRSPWIKDASLRRVLPSTLEVAIGEREPLGIGRLRGDLFLVSTDGVIIDEYGPRYAHFDLPIIDGLHAGPSSGNGLLVDEQRALLAAAVLKDLRGRPELSGRVSQVDVSSPDNAIVLLGDDAARVHLGRDSFADRLQSYLDLAPTLRAKVSAIDYVDLRFESRVFVRPVGDRQRPPLAIPKPANTSKTSRQ